jgi:hypothetical protein
MGLGYRIKKEPDPQHWSLIIWPRRLTPSSVLAKGPKMYGTGPTEPDPVSDPEQWLDVFFEGLEPSPVT